MRILGIVGTAKNTGKTTTLGALITESAARGERLAVTGIGYDGEEIDTVTGLPKPRLLLRAGTIVVTSERCLAHTTAGFRVVKATEAETALGRVVIVEITQDGLMVLAGPNTKRLVRSVISELREYGVGRLFIDGSLNRIAAMSAVETMIFTTGASRAREIGFLSEESRAICRLFDLPEFASDAGAAPTERVRILDHTGAVASELPFGSLYDADDAVQAIGMMSEDSSAIVIPNMLSLRALEALAAGLGTRSRALTIVVNDATVMLLAGEPIATVRAIESAASADARRAFTIAYRHHIRVAAMTVNPFYPRQSEHAFVPDYIDKTALLSGVARAVPVPVFNIMDAGAPRSLFSLL